MAVEIVLIVLILIGEERDRWIVLGQVHGIGETVVDQVIIRNQRDQDQRIVADRDQGIVRYLNQGIIADLYHDQNIIPDRDQEITRYLNQGIVADRDQGIAEDHVIIILRNVEGSRIQDLVHDHVIEEDNTILYCECNILPINQLNCSTSRLCKKFSSFVL